MPDKKNISPFGGILSKLVLTGLLIIASGILAVYYVESTFDAVLTRTENLSRPNEKLRTLNSFYQSIVRLDEKQQTALLTNANANSTLYQTHVDSLLQILEQIKTQGWTAEQISHLNTISEIIENRNEVLEKYIEARANQQRNVEFNKSLDTLSALLNQQALRVDTSVISTKTTKKYKTTPPEQAAEQPEESRGFFDRLFGSKKEKPQPEQQQDAIIEEINIIIDTLSVSHRDTLLQEATDLIKKAEKKQKHANTRVKTAEIRLIEANANLLNQVLMLVQEVEQEELERINAGNAAVNDLVTASIQRMMLLFLIIFVIAALLGLLMVIDLSKAKFYRKKLTAERDRAEQLSQVKERFLANMSHELRTPLQSILGYSEQLHQQLPEREEVTVIHSASEHLLHIVNEVLDYSRISSGKMIFDNQPTNLSEVVSDVVKNIRAQTGGRNIRILKEDFLEGLEVYTDPFRIRQILFNLLGNAVKFTEEGFVKVQSRLRETKPDLFLVEFIVEDTGIGMTPEELEKVFGDFEQANARISRNFGGTGLGLSIVKSLITACNGTVNIESEKGAGTKITILLKLKKIPKGAATSTLPADHKEGPQKKYEFVLVVDDDQGVLNLTRTILQKNGIRCQAASSAKQAIELCKVHEFDLALLDIRMPEMTGTELCEKLLQIRPALSCVAFTAHVMETERRNILNSGFHDILNKPCKEQELLKILGHMKTNHSSENGAASDFESLNQALQKFTQGDEELIKKIATQFHTDTKTDLEQLNKSLKATNSELAREAIHRLSGRLGMFEARKLASGFKQAEIDLVENKATAEFWHKAATLAEAAGELNQQLEHQLSIN